MTGYCTNVGNVIKLYYNLEHYKSYQPKCIHMNSHKIEILHKIISNTYEINIIIRNKHTLKYDIYLDLMVYCITKETICKKKISV